MALVLDSEQEMIRDSALAFVRDRLPVSVFRAQRASGEAFDRAAWREMAALGWTGMLLPEAVGGTGFGYRGLGLAMEALGRTLAKTPMLSTAALSARALDLAGGHEDLLRGIVSGETIMAFAIDEGPRHAPDSIALAAKRAGSGYVLGGRKMFVADGGVADKFVVVARDANGFALFLVNGDAQGLTRERLTMVDYRDAAHITFADVVAKRLGDAPLDDVLDGGRVMLAAEMLGMAQEVLERTLEHLRTRKQFNVAIGSFQALKHRAVEIYCAIELARSCVLDAMNALDEKRADVHRLASLAKAKANDALLLTAQEAVQMHGGMGITDELDIGLFLKRARVAIAQLGDTAFHTDRYAALEGF